MTKRAIIYGNMPYKEITSTETQKLFKITYWDFWIAIVLKKKCNNDWNTLLDHLRSQVKKNYSLRFASEALMTHIRWLRQALDDAGVHIKDILADADEAFLKREEKKAIRKILELNFQEKENSEWMLHTPRKIREARAMRGYWERFPVNPTEYATLLEGRYKTSGYYSEDQSFTLEKKLVGFLKKHTARKPLAKLFAIYRAFLTVVIEKFEMVDDSYGVIGDLYQKTFQIYFQLARTELQMNPEDFFQDIIELMLWEDYGFFDAKLSDFFASLSASEVSMAESILEQQQKELKEVELEYLAEKTLTLLKILKRSLKTSRKGN